MPFDVQGALNAGYSPAQIADEVGKAAGFDTGAARQHGYTDDQIIKELAAPTKGPRDSSFLADLKAGANSAMENTGTALQGAGGILQRNGLPGGETISGAGEFLRNNAPAVPQNYHDRGGDIISDLKAGNYSRAAGDVVHGVAGAAPGAAAAIGAGALGSAVGAPAAVGAGLAGGIMGLGAGAGERATAEGNAVPNTSQMVRALPRAAADAILSGIGPGKLAARSGNALGRTATMAGASGAQSGVDQYDTTGTVNPEQMGNAAITGAALSGATEVPGAVRGGAQKASDAVMSRVVGAPEGQVNQTSAVRVAQGVKDAQAADPSLNNTAAANRVKLDLVQRANRVLAQVKPLIDADDYRDIRSDINDGARRHNNTVSDGTFDLIDSLDISDAHKQALTEYTRDLNTASTQSFINNTTGPLQKLGGVVGRVGSIGAGIASGNPLEMAAGVLGHSLGGRIGAGLGAVGDRALGLNTPPVLLQAQAAARALRRAGVDPNGITPTPMPSRVQPNPVTGNMPDPVPTNTPIPFKPNTPNEALAAMAQDDGRPPSQAPIQAAQMAAAATPPTNGAAPPTSPQVPAWQRFVQNGNAGITPEMMLAAARRAEANGALPQGQSALLEQHPGGIDPVHAQAIQAELQNASGQAQGDQPKIYSPQRYQLAANNYHTHVAAEVARLHQSGQTEAAQALLDIAVNKHSKADKQAARDALPMALRVLIPDWVVNQGGK
jgi:hypothetical protein